MYELGIRHAFIRLVARRGGTELKEPAFYAAEWHNGAIHENHRRFRQADSGNPLSRLRSGGRRKLRTQHWPAAQHTHRNAASRRKTPRTRSSEDLIGNRAGH